MPTRNSVLFVDDEVGVRSSWDRVLTQYGFDVTTAEDGARAINLLSERPVDVVISDLKMPGVDGIQLLEWISAKSPDTRFVLLTGYGSEDVEHRARELGAFDYLNKPISPDTLAAVVTAASLLKVAVPAAVTETPEVRAVAQEVEAPAKSGARRLAEIAGGLIVAPLLGLAFVVLLPVIGFGAFLYSAARAVGERFCSASP